MGGKGKDFADRGMRECITIEADVRKQGETKGRDSR
jgi:hypothetical protein